MATGHAQLNTPPKDEQISLLCFVLFHLRLRILSSFITKRFTIKSAGVWWKMQLQPTQTDEFAS